MMRRNIYWILQALMICMLTDCSSQPVQESTLKIPIGDEMLEMVEVAGGTAFGCRVSYIDYDTDGYRDEYGGFRLALDKDSIHE